MATISARDFNRDVSAAKRAAADAPVIITDRGKPAFVLMSYAEYQRGRAAQGGPRTVVDWLQTDDEIDWEPAVLGSFPRVPPL